MNFIKIVFQKIWAVVMVLIKFCLFMAVMFAGAWALAPLGTIHSKDIDMSQFNNHPNEMMMNFFQMEYFSGYLFSVTIAVVLAGVYGMWQLHELGVHKAKSTKALTYKSCLHCHFVDSSSAKHSGLSPWLSHWRTGNILVNH